MRSPASANSIVGIRPTIGVVSRSGIVPYALTQDTAGAMARTVADAVLLLDVIAGYDPQDASTAWGVGRIPETYTAFLKKGGLKGARIGVPRGFFGAGPEHAEVNAAFSRLDRGDEKAGGDYCPLRLRYIHGQPGVGRKRPHAGAEGDHLDAYLKSRKAPMKSLEEVYASGKFHPGIGSIIRQALGLSTSDVEYKDRLIKRARLQDAFMKIMADNRLDAMIFPHQRCLVAPVGRTQAERQGILTSATGFPSIVIPAGFSAPSETAPIGSP